jgi:ATP-dependent helicase HepA
VIFRDDVDTPANAWFDLLNSGFGIFTGSIASLQEANERLKGRIQETIVLGSPTDLRELSSWVAQQLEQELGAVEIAEVLDETVLDDRGRELLEGIEVAESSVEIQSWRNAVIRWASGDGSTAAHLRFHHEEGSDQQRGQDTFRLTSYEMPNVSGLTDSDLPLVPWSDLDRRFAGSMRNSEASGSFRRTTATHRHLRLLGPGDPFIDALWEFTEIDDRGHAFALWRAREFWDRDEAMFTCFTLRIRPDISRAIESTGRPLADVESALRRRAQSYLAPVFERVWLDVEANQVRDEALLGLLNAPYADNRGDRTLRPQMWHRLHDHVPADHWADWCAAQRQQARALVRARNHLDQKCAQAARLAGEDSDDLVARLSVRKDDDGRRAVDLERSIGKALTEGIRNPESEVDAIGIVVLSNAVLPNEGEL